MPTCRDPQRIRIRIRVRRRRSLAWSSARLATALALALALAASPARALETLDTPAIGGIGGAPFRQMCPQGSWLVGMRFRSGAWIDAVAPICGDWVGQAREFQGIAWSVAPWRGGNGGSENFTLCGGGSAIAGMRGQQSTNEDGSVGWVRPDCRRATPPHLDWQDPWAGAIEAGQQSMRGGLRRATDESLCPPGMLGVGLYGRSGLFVDRLGVVCAAAPPPEGTPMPALLPPAQPPRRPIQLKLGDTTRVQSGSRVRDPFSR